MNKKFNKLSIVTALLFLFAFNIGLFAQVKIGDNPTTKNAASVLELESTNQALLITRVANTSTITTPVNGMMVYDISAKCFRFYQDNSWSGCLIANGVVEGNVTGLTCASATFNPAIVYAENAYSGTATVPYTGGNGGIYSAGTGIASTDVTGLTATLQAGTLNTGDGQLTYTVTGTPNKKGTASFAISFGGQSCTISVEVISEAGIIPENLTLGQNQKFFVASVYDLNYLPYTAPTTPATTDTPVDPDTNEEEGTVDFQGFIGEIEVNLPVKATGSGTLPAYSTTVNVPAELTEDLISRNVTFSWASQTYTMATTSITLKIVAEEGKLLAKKLDVNAGIGNDYLGVLMASFSYPYNNAGTMCTYQLRDIASIPDKMFGLADNGGVVRHNFLYLPIVGEDGNVWLNNNLGADYANVSLASFNIAQQATTFDDYRAYGSLFQWGRKPDGHELIKWSSGIEGAPVNGTTPTRDDNPTHALFIIDGTDWRLTPNNVLWNTEAGDNNPCPSGFRVATNTELTALVTAAGITDYNTAAASNLKFSVPGTRMYTDGNLSGAGSNGYYWSSSVNGSFANYRFFHASSTTTTYTQRPNGFTVRCIKD